MKTIDEINRANVAQISAAKKLPNFFPGDIIKVGVKITEGKRDRIQSVSYTHLTLPTTYHV